MMDSTPQLPKTYWRLLLVAWGILVPSVLLLVAAGVATAALDFPRAMMMIVFVIVISGWSWYRLSRVGNVPTFGSERPLSWGVITIATLALVFLIAMLSRTIFMVH